MCFAVHSWRAYLATIVSGGCICAIEMELSLAAYTICGARLVVAAKASLPLWQQLCAALMVSAIRRAYACATSLP